MDSNKTWCANDQEENDVSEELHDNGEELQAWCLLEESENEQWQEVISRRDKQLLKNAAHASLLSALRSKHPCSVAVHVKLEGMSHMGNSRAKHHQRDSWQRMVSKPTTWLRKRFRLWKSAVFQGVHFSLSACLIFLVVGKASCA